MPLREPGPLPAAPDPIVAGDPPDGLLLIPLRDPAPMTPGRDAAEPPPAEGSDNPLRREPEDGAPPLGEPVMALRNPGELPPGEAGVREPPLGLLSALREAPDLPLRPPAGPPAEVFDIPLRVDPGVRNGWLDETELMLLLKSLSGRRALRTDPIALRANTDSGFD